MKTMIASGIVSYGHEGKVVYMKVMIHKHLYTIEKSFSSDFLGEPAYTFIMVSVSWSISPILTVKFYLSSTFIDYLSFSMLLIM